MATFWKAAGKMREGRKPLRDAYDLKNISKRQISTILVFKQLS